MSPEMRSATATAQHTSETARMTEEGASTEKASTEKAWELLTETSPEQLPALDAALAYWQHH